MFQVNLKAFLPNCPAVASVSPREWAGYKQTGQQPTKT